MADKTSEKKGEAAKKEVEEKREEGVDAQSACGSCPVAKALGLCENMTSFVQDLKAKDFLVHMANARREVLLGIKGLVDEAIRMEDERIAKHRTSAGASRQKKEDNLNRISIE
ncbi:MAG: hypothetical protein C4536_03445 [Actinobacteria bacterium]|jgi:hypothetical protein|nr:MAG: hypothetical protein C4536_03445 [Actinomycetota bacterium]